MRYALSISAFAHVAILASAFVALPDPEKFKVTPSEAVPVEIIAEQDLAKPKPPEKPPEPEKKPEPPKKPPEEVKKPAKPKPEPKRVAALPPEPVPEPEPVEKPPENKPVEEKPPEPEPIEKKVEEPPKQVEKVYPTPKRKPKPPKKKKPPKKSHEDEVAALLNKLPDESPPERSIEELLEETAPTETETVAEVSQTGTQLERSEIAAIIRSKMARCWNPPTGLQNAGSLQVKFKLSLKPNGELLGNPVSQTSASDALTRAAVESARRALIRCAPYGLPQNTYDVWKEMVLNFDPSSMF